MKRYSFHQDGRRLSYLDQEGSAPPLIALHAHWMEARTYEGLSSALSPQWRAIALDQRGHGCSDHAPTYTRDDYLCDVDALYRELRIDSAVLLGNSLGGVNAYQFAARYPQRVRALIVEDIGAFINDDTSFALAWRGSFPTREALSQKIGPRIARYLEPSFRETTEGWQLAFDPRDTVASQTHLNGDHWKDWLASTCPALLIGGAESRVTSQSHLEEMASRRPNTRLRTLPGGHVVHVDSPEEFGNAVKDFLSELDGKATTDLTGKLSI